VFICGFNPQFCGIYPKQAVLTTVTPARKCAAMCPKTYNAIGSLLMIPLLVRADHLGRTVASPG